MFSSTINSCIFIRRPLLNTLCRNYQSLAITTSLPRCATCKRSKEHTVFPSTQLNIPNSQLIHCSYSSGVLNGDGLMNRTWNKLGLKKMRYKKTVLKFAGLRLYLCCTDMIDYRSFFQEFPLEDTFFSWFRITELHVWLVMVRLAAEGPEGKLARDAMITSMWEDVTKRTRLLGNASLTARREGIMELADRFKGSLFAYDEGLIADDKLLACALWRTFLLQKCTDPAQLESLVHYVRKQVHHIDLQKTDVVLGHGIMTFLPLHGDKEDEERTKFVIKEIAMKF